MHVTTTGEHACSSSTISIHDTLNFSFNAAVCTGTWMMDSSLVRLFLLPALDLDRLAAIAVSFIFFRGYLIQLLKQLKQILFLLFLPVYSVTCN